jgi:DNA-binding MarR family transcriptional regulator
MRIQNDPEKLAQLLHSSAIRLLRSLRQADESSGLTASRMSALSVIVFSGQITLGDLAAAEQVRPPTMTRIVNALVEQQLVKKVPDQRDGRMTRIAATVRGKRELLKGRAHRLTLLAEGIQSLTVAEQKNLSTALDAMQRLAERISIA